MSSLGRSPVKWDTIVPGLCGPRDARGVLQAAGFSAFLLTSQAIGPHNESVRIMPVRALHLTGVDHCNHADTIRFLTAHRHEAAVRDCCVRSSGCLQRVGGQLRLDGDPRCRLCGSPHNRHSCSSPSRSFAATVRAAWRVNPSAESQCGLRASGSGANPGIRGWGGERSASAVDSTPPSDSASLG